MRLSPVWAGFGDMVTVGAVGLLFTRKERVSVVLRPAGSVAVTRMLCTPALREADVKLILPLLSGAWLEISPAKIYFSYLDCLEIISMSFSYQNESEIHFPHIHTTKIEVSTVRGF